MSILQHQQLIKKPTLPQKTEYNITNANGELYMMALLWHPVQDVKRMGSAVVAPHAATC